MPQSDGCFAVIPNRHQFTFELFLGLFWSISSSILSPLFTICQTWSSYSSLFMVKFGQWTTALQPTRWWVRLRGCTQRIHMTTTMSQRTRAIPCCERIRMSLLQAISTKCDTPTWLLRCWLSQKLWKANFSRANLDEDSKYSWLPDIIGLVSAVDHTIRIRDQYSLFNWHGLLISLSRSLPAIRQIIQECNDIKNVYLDSKDF